MMGLFGKDPKRSPKEQVREWNSKLRKQQFLLDRNIRNIQREEEKTKMELKKAAKRGDKDVCLVLAKEIVNARKSVNRIQTSKAQINSVMMHMTQQLATLRVAGAMEKSAGVMKSMSSLMKVSELSAVMQEMSREMMKAGIIEDMVEEVLDEQQMDDELEEEAQQEVDRVLYELTAGQLGNAPQPITESLPPAAEKTVEKSRPTAEKRVPEAERNRPVASTSQDDDEDISEMRQRLDALRS